LLPAQVQWYPEYEWSFVHGRRQSKDKIEQALSTVQSGEEKDGRSALCHEADVDVVADTAAAPHNPRVVRRSLWSPLGPLSRRRRVGWDARRSDDAADHDRRSRAETVSGPLRATYWPFKNTDEDDCSWFALDQRRATSSTAVHSTGGLDARKRNGRSVILEKNGKKYDHDDVVLPSRANTVTTGLTVLAQSYRIATVDETPSSTDNIIETTAQRWAHCSCSSDRRHTVTVRARVRVWREVEKTSLRARQCVRRFYSIILRYLQL